LVQLSLVTAISLNGVRQVKHIRYTDKNQKRQCKKG